MGISPPACTIFETLEDMKGVYICTPIAETQPASQAYAMKREKMAGYHRSERRCMPYHAEEARKKKDLPTITATPLQNYLLPRYLLHPPPHFRLSSSLDHARFRYRSSLTIPHHQISFPTWKEDSDLTL